MSLPWMRFYPAETLADEHFSGWTCEERGAWFTLLLLCWREGSIPADQTSLGRLLHLDSGDLRRVWSAIGSRFVESDDAPGRLVSPRLEDERQKAVALYAKRSKAGAAAVKARWDRKKKRNTNRIRNVEQSNTNVIRPDTSLDPDPDLQETKAVSPQAGLPAAWEQLRDSVADRMAVPRDWMRLSRPEDAEATRSMLTAEVERLGMARAVEVCREAAFKAKSKPRWMRYFLGPLQEASRHRVEQDGWQGTPATAPASEDWPMPTPEQVEQWTREAAEELRVKTRGLD